MCCITANLLLACIIPELIVNFSMMLFCPIRFNSALVTDKRVRIMNEVISGIRVIKMYAWENAFSKLISRLRRYGTIT